LGGKYHPGHFEGGKKEKEKVKMPEKKERARARERERLIGNEAHRPLQRLLQW